MRLYADCEFLEDGRTIELLSIGIVREDGAEYYAEVAVAPDVQTRVLNHEWLMANVIPHMDSTDFKSRDQIAHEIREFTRCTGNDEPEWWGYCSAYDWVVINQLYGSMVDHPKQWPFYCNDIAQLGMHVGINRRLFPEQTTVEHNALSDAKWTRDTYLWLMEQARN